MTRVVQSLYDISELEVEFEQSVFPVRLWLRRYGPTLLS